MRNLSYTSRLEMLGLERLETRRLHHPCRPYHVLQNCSEPCWHTLWFLMSSLNIVNITVHVVTH